MNFTIPGSVPHEVPPGIEYRTRKIAADIKGSMVYSQADGELLGIVAPGSAPDAPDTISADDLTFKTLANFEIQAKFRKRGMDALKLQFRRIGGDWQSAGFLVSSPGTFAITPSTPGTAEQIEIRAIFLKGNTEVGNYTNAIPAFIAVSYTHLTLPTNREV